MACDSRTPVLPEVPDTAQVLQANRLAPARLMAARLLITVILVAVPVAFSRVMDSHSIFFVLPIVAGVFVCVATVYRVAYGIRISQCARVLHGYPLEFYPSGAQEA